MLHSPGIRLTDPVEDHDTVVAMPHGAFPIALQHFDTDEEDTHQQDQRFVFELPEVLDGRIVMVQSERVGIELRDGLGSAVEVFIQRADGHERMAHGRLKVTELEHKVGPEV